MRQVYNESNQRCSWPHKGNEAAGEKRYVLNCEMDQQRHQHYQQPAASPVQKRPDPGGFLRRAQLAVQENPQLNETDQQKRQIQEKHQKPVAGEITGKWKDKPEVNQPHGFKTML